MEYENIGKTKIVFNFDTGFSTDETFDLPKQISIVEKAFGAKNRTLVFNLPISDFLNCATEQSILQSKELIEKFYETMIGMSATDIMNRIKKSMSPAIQPEEFIKNFIKNKG